MSSPSGDAPLSYPSASDYSATYSEEFVEYPSLVRCSRTRPSHEATALSFQESTVSRLLFQRSLHPTAREFRPMLELAGLSHLEGGEHCTT